MDLELLRHVTEQIIPFNRFLGVRAVAVSKGRVELEIPWREELIGDPVRQAIHGGVIGTLADTAGGMAIWSEVENPSQRVSTIDLRIDYLRPGKPETLVADAVVVRVGHHISVADVRLFHRSAPDATVATAKGVYAIKTVKPSAAPTSA